MRTPETPDTVEPKRDARGLFGLSDESSPTTSMIAQHDKVTALENEVLDRKMEYEEDVAEFQNVVAKLEAKISNFEQNEKVIMDNLSQNEMRTFACVISFSLSSYSFVPALSRTAGVQCSSCKAVLRSPLADGGCLCFCFLGWAFFRLRTA